MSVMTMKNTITIIQLHEYLLNDFTPNRFLLRAKIFPFIDLLRFWWINQETRTFFKKREKHLIHVLSVWRDFPYRKNRKCMYHSKCEKSNNFRHMNMSKRLEKMLQNELNVWQRILILIRFFSSIHCLITYGFKHLVG